MFVVENLMIAMIMFIPSCSPYDYSIARKTVVPCVEYVEISLLEFRRKQRDAFNAFNFVKKKQINMDPSARWANQRRMISW